MAPKLPYTGSRHSVFKGKFKGAVWHKLQSGKTSMLKNRMVKQSKMQEVTNPK